MTWIKVWFFGSVVWGWKCPDDLLSVAWKSGKAFPGCVWASVDPDGPYRPLKPA